MTHRGSFQPLTFCDSVKTISAHLFIFGEGLPWTPNPTELPTDRVAINSKGLLEKNASERLFLLFPQLFLRALFCSLISISQWGKKKLPSESWEGVAFVFLILRHRQQLLSASMG